MPNPAGGVGFACDSSGTQRQRGFFSTDGGATFLGPLVLQDQQGRQTQVNVMVRAVLEPIATSSSCTYSVTHGFPSLAASGGSGTVSVTAPSGCAWSASSGVPWITVSPTSGSGNGAVTYTLPVNTDAQARSGTLTVAGLTVPISQAGAEAEGRTLVPVVLATAGAAGSYFTSEITFTNRGTTDAIAELRYTAALVSGTGTGYDVIPAGAQVTLPDAIAYLRSAGVPIPDSGNRGGTLALRLLGVSSAAAVSATVRTTSLVPEGRAGLAYGDVPPAAALTAPVYLCGLRQNAQDRSNVALVNAGGASDGDVTLRLTVFSGDPASPVKATLPDVFLAPGAFSQISGILGSSGLSLANATSQLVKTLDGQGLGPRRWKQLTTLLSQFAPGTTNGYVKVTRVEGSNPFLVYGVVNDGGQPGQRTGDGAFVAMAAVDE